MNQITRTAGEIFNAVIGEIPVKQPPGEIAVLGVNCEFRVERDSGAEGVPHYKTAKPGDVCTATTEGKFRVHIHMGVPLLGTKWTWQRFAAVDASTLSVQLAFDCLFCDGTPIPPAPRSHWLS